MTRRLLTFGIIQIFFCVFKGRGGIGNRLNGKRGIGVGILYPNGEGLGFNLGMGGGFGS